MIGGIDHVFRKDLHCQNWADHLTLLRPLPFAGEEHWLEVQLAAPSDVHRATAVVRDKPLVVIPHSLRMVK